VARPTIQRWLLLGGALLATVIASVWPRAEERAAPEVVAPVARAERATAEKRALPARTELPKLNEQLERAPTATAKVEDLFGATSWNTERRPARVEPVVPTAPPFPYAITGTLLDRNGLMVVFAKENQDFVVRAGDLLDENYRVEAIDPQSVTVRYLPLKITQVLPMGALQ